MEAPTLHDAMAVLYLGYGTTILVILGVAPTLAGARAQPVERLGRWILAAGSSRGRRRLLFQGRSKRDQGWRAKRR